MQRRKDEERLRLLCPLEYLRDAMTLSFRANAAVTMTSQLRTWVQLAQTRGHERYMDDFEMWKLLLVRYVAC